MMMKRTLLVLIAALLLPALAWAQSGTRATFLTAKLYTDGNPNNVDVTMSCNTGLPLEQTKSLEPVLEGGDYVDYVIVDFDSGELDCEVTEDVPAGYQVLYVYGYVADNVMLPMTFAAAENLAGISGDVDISEDACFFEDILDENDQPPEAQYFCLVINVPAPVDVEIEKEWVISAEDENLNGVSTFYRIDLYCDGPILSVNNGGSFYNSPDLFGIITEESHAWWYADTSSDQTFIAEVRPDEFGENECSVEESEFDSAVEVTNGCGEFDIDVDGGPYTCTMTNTVFFEGIPTLSQYGLAILALLMLGVGFIGFRRLV